MSSDFAGVGLSIEPVYGARSFDVDSLGRLNAVSYKHVWLPGQNEATCHKPLYSGGTYGSVDIAALAATFQRQMLWIEGGASRGLALGGPSAPTPPPLPKKHDMGTCSCGFYSYFDNSADYHDGKRVNAVVEGYGETVIGSRGFRSKKARIVALHIPGPRAHVKAGGFRHALHRFHYKHAFPTIALLATLLAIAVAFGGSAIKEGVPALAAPAVLAAVSIVLWWKSMLASDDCGCIPRRYQESSLGLAPKLAEKVRRNYDGIPVYDTFEAMVEAHPLTASPEPSPTDDDFWTRRAS